MMMVDLAELSSSRSKAAESAGHALAGLAVSFPVRIWVILVVGVVMLLDGAGKIVLGVFFFFLYYCCSSV